jgi:hypothetical protein
MMWAIVKYPPRLWEVERAVIRHRLVVVIRRRRAQREGFAEIRRAA